jgi:hypothetical protein
VFLKMPRQRSSVKLVGCVDPETADVSSGGITADSKFGSVAGIQSRAGGLLTI